MGLSIVHDELLELMVGSSQNEVENAIYHYMMNRGDIESYTFSWNKSKIYLEWEFDKNNAPIGKNGGKLVRGSIVKHLNGFDLYRDYDRAMGVI